MTAATYRRTRNKYAERRQDVARFERLILPRIRRAAGDVIATRRLVEALPPAADELVSPRVVGLAQEYHGDLGVARLNRLVGAIDEAQRCLPALLAWYESELAMVKAFRREMVQARKFPSGPAYRAFRRPSKFSLPEKARCPPRWSSP